MQDAQTGNITSVLNEARVFKPSKEFSKQAHIKSLAEYRKLYRESIRSPEKFWAKQARNELVWFKPWKTVLQWKEPFAKWFVGGQLNLSVNCLDRWLNTPTANKAALIWEGEPATDGKPLATLNVEQPLATGPVTFMQHLVATAADGTILVVDKP